MICIFNTLITMNESDDLPRSDNNPDCIRSTPTIEHQKERDLLLPERMANCDYRTTPLSQLQRDFSCFYYNALNAGYKCKTCEMFPDYVVGSRGKNKFKFGCDAVKLRHTLESIRNQKETKEIRGSPSWRYQNF